MLWTYTSFKSFKRAVPVKRAKFEKTGFTPMIIKIKLRVLTFELRNPTLMTEDVFDIN